MFEERSFRFYAETNSHHGTQIASITFSAAKIFLTETEISGPIPSPGMSVTICLPS
jgi:hypothetical protein